MIENPSREYLIHNVVWGVDLNDGRRIYQNDTTGNSSWLELKEYLFNNKKLHIQNMFLQFRDNFQHVGSDNEAYFFSKRLMSQFGCENDQFFYIVGATNNDNLHVKHFRIPDLIIGEEDDRDISNGQYIRNIILHPDYIEHLSYKEYFDE